MNFLVRFCDVLISLWTHGYTHIMSWFGGSTENFTLVYKLQLESVPEPRYLLVHGHDNDYIKG